MPAEIILYNRQPDAGLITVPTESEIPYFVPSSGATCVDR